MNDVQQLILWALGGETVSPSWVFLKNKPMVKQVVVLLAHGLSASSFEEKQGLMPNLSSLTSNVIKVQAHTGKIITTTA